MASDMIYEQLCELLGDELERQETVLAVSRGLRDALLVHDLECIEARTAALDILTRESLQADRQRKNLLKQLFGDTLPTKLSTVTEQMPAPWNTRVNELREAIQAAVTEARPVAQGNATLLRSSLNVVRSSLAAVEEQTFCDLGRYDARGENESTLPTEPALLNQRG